MPAENLEEQGLEKYPNSELSQYKFFLILPEHQNNVTIRKKLMDAIKDDNMAPFYEYLIAELHWTVDKDLLDRKKKQNRLDLKKTG